jgi:hypothetical protein
MTFPAQPLLVGLWIVIIIAQGYVFALLVSRRAYRVYPAFTGFIAFQVVRSLVLFYLANYCASLYQPVKWATYAVPQLPILIALVWEVFHILFHPYNTLPKQTIGHFVHATVVIAIIATAFAIRFPGAQPTAWMTFARATDQVVTWVLCAVFAFIALFASYFGIPWRHRVYGIGVGFLLYLAVDVVVETAIAQWRLPAYSPISYFGMFAFLGACVIWAYYFATEEAPRSAPTLEELRKLGPLLDEFATAVRRAQWTRQDDGTSGYSSPRSEQDMGAPETGD